MHTTNQILDALSAKLDGASDYRIHKVLNTSSTSVISAWRKGRSLPDAFWAAKIAGLLEWPHAYVMACIEHERAEKSRAAGRDPNEQSGEILRTWEAIAKAFPPRALPGVLLATFALFGALNSSDVHAVAPATSQARECDDLCIIRAWVTRASKTLARWWRTFFPALDTHIPLATHC